MSWEPLSVEALFPRVSGFSAHHAQWYNDYYADPELHHTRASSLKWEDHVLQYPRDYVESASGDVTYCPVIQHAPYRTFCGEILLPIQHGNNGVERDARPMFSVVHLRLGRGGLSGAFRYDPTLQHWRTINLRLTVASTRELAHLRQAFLPCWRWIE